MNLKHIVVVFFLSSCLTVSNAREVTSEVQDALKQFENWYFSHWEDSSELEKDVSPLSESSNGLESEEDEAIFVARRSVCTTPGVFAVGDCTSYYRCTSTLVMYQYVCPAGTYFDPTLLKCTLNEPAACVSTSTTLTTQSTTPSVSTTVSTTPSISTTQSTTPSVSTTQSTTPSVSTTQSTIPSTTLDTSTV